MYQIHKRNPGAKQGDAPNYENGVEKEVHKKFENVCHIVLLLDLNMLQGEPHPEGFVVARNTGSLRAAPALPNTEESVWDEAVGPTQGFHRATGSQPGSRGHRDAIGCTLRQPQA